MAIAKRLLVATLALLALLATCVVNAAATRPGVIIYAVGDTATAGQADKAATNGGRFGASYSYRRYLYFMLTARGYEVRFVGSNSECGLPGVDFDSHHDGYEDMKASDLRNKVSSESAKIRESLANAVSSLQATGEVESITLVRIVSAGAYDMYAGRSAREISDNDLRGLVDAVQSATDGVPGITTKHNALVIPSPPPGGKREKEGDTWSIARDFARDSKYEDYRFFLTWRGTWFSSKTVADCFSYFDFLRHYSKDGTRLNALGDMALARCVFDNLRTRKLIPKVPDNTPRRNKCDAASTDLLLKRPESKAQAATDGRYFEPVLVNRALPPLTSIIAPAVLLEFSAAAKHPTCTALDNTRRTAAKAPRTEAEEEDPKKDDAAGATGGGKNAVAAGGAAAGGVCKGTPLFPQYEPFTSTTRDLWKGESSE